jgi:probable HAF family extracellular repeat protein
MKSLLVRAVSVIVCLCGLASAANIQYRFSPSGDYPGASETFPQADSIHQIVGYYNNTKTAWGYLQDLRKPKAEQFRSIRPPGSWIAWLSGINLDGVAVGGYCSPPHGCGYPQGEHGFMFDHGTYTTIDYPGVTSSATFGINGLGQIVGGYCNISKDCPGSAFSSANGGFLYDHGTFTAINYPGTTLSEANAINNAGEIVGTYDDVNGGPRSYLYQSGVFTNIDVPGSTFTNVSAINNKGVAAGYYQLRNASIHGFLRYANGTFVTIDIDHASARATSLAGINDAGVVVGAWVPYQGLPLTFKGVPVRTSP